jgi:hypothetical protein
LARWRPGAAVEARSLPRSATRPPPPGIEAVPLTRHGVHEPGYPFTERFPCLWEWAGTVLYFEVRPSASGEYGRPRPGPAASPYPRSRCPRDRPRRDVHDGGRRDVEHAAGVGVMLANSWIQGPPARRSRRHYLSGRDGLVRVFDRRHGQDFWNCEYGMFPASARE